MSESSLRLSRLFSEQREKLRLEWLLHTDQDPEIALKEQGSYGADLVGHLNIIHPDRLQVIGKAEAEWIARTSPERVRRLIFDLLQSRPPAFIVSDEMTPPEVIVEACQETLTPLLLSGKTSSANIDMLRMYLAHRLAEHVSVHGVFMDVLGMGVLITGDSGVGKSELALELISRGHGLVADDIVQLARIAPTTIEGTCPGMLRDFLEVRGLGLLNIRTIFGEIAARRKMKLKLIVHLQKQQAGSDAPRLPLDSQTQEILGLAIRKVVIPVAAGRNLAVLLESAVRNHILKLRGIDSMDEFITRQHQAMMEGMEE